MRPSNSAAAGVISGPFGSVGSAARRALVRKTPKRLTSRTELRTIDYPLKGSQLQANAPRPSYRIGSRPYMAPRNSEPQRSSGWTFGPKLRCVVGHQLDRF